MIYKEKIKKAIKFSIKTHEIYQKQKRKGKDVSYITHPLTVGIILSMAGADEDVIAAGILHDTIEDCVPEKRVTYEMLERRFGKRVADGVLSVTESNKKLFWEARKKEALKKIKKYSHDSLLIKSADIISNASELLDDYARYGEEVFKRFNASKDKIVHHHMETTKAILEKWNNNPLREDLEFLQNLIKENFFNKQKN